MKKIIIVTHSAANGGAERVSCILANQLVERGYEVTLYAVYSDNRQYYLDEHVNYVYADVKFENKVLKGISRAAKLRKYIASNNFDVMLSFVYLDCVFLSRMKSIKKIYTLRNDPHHVCNKGISKYLFKKIYRSADKIVFQTPDARDFFDKDISSKGVVIANPVRQGLPYWNRESHNNDIVTACRINKQKNLKMMIDAFKLFNEINSDYRLVIYGKGDLQEYYEDYAESLGLSEKVLFPGFCDSIQDKMAEAAMFVSSSDYEGISNSMLEALAIGVPTVCTDCPIGGARMTIENGVNGYLVDVGDSASMADKMLEIVKNTDLQYSFSDESQKLRASLTEENIINNWIREIEN